MGVRWRHFGISLKLILLVSASVIALLIATFLASKSLLGRWALEGAQELAFTILDQTDKRLTSFFDEMEDLARGLAGTRPVREADPEGMRDLFVATVVPRARYLRAVYLGTASGTMHEWGVGKGFTDHEPSFPPGYDPRQRPWYRLAVDSGDFAVTDPYHYASVADIGITCVLPVSDGKGGLVGVLGLDILLEDLRGILEGLEIPRGGRALLLSPSGEILASQLAPERVADLPLGRFEHPGGPALLERVSGAFLGELDGERTYFVHKRSAKPGWTIVLAMPLDPIMASSVTLLRLMGALDLVLTILLILVVASITSSLLLAPLRSIVAAINRLEAGEAGVRADVRREDEFGLLAGELNKLADQVEENARSLEAKVRERTEALARLERENTQLRVVEERQRIYRDLHDTIGARLTNIFFCNGVARDMARNAPSANAPGLAELFDRVEGNCLEAIDSIKRTISREDGERDGEGDLAVFLSQGVRRRLDAGGVAYSCGIEGKRRLRLVDGAARAELEKLVDELVTNVLRHAKAERVRLRLRAGEKGLRLDFADDGAGFDPAAAVSPSYGLDNIRWRAERLGGRVDLRSLPGKGTRYRIEVPLSGGTDGTDD